MFLLNVFWGLHLQFTGVLQFVFVTAAVSLFFQQRTVTWKLFPSRTVNIISVVHVFWTYQS